MKIVVFGSLLSATRVQRRVREQMGSFEEDGRMLSEELISERREEAEREAKREEAGRKETLPEAGLGEERPTGPRG